LPRFLICHPRPRMKRPHWLSIDTTCAFDDLSGHSTAITKYCLVIKNKFQESSKF
jgi:hypothetical protein